MFFFKLNLTYLNIHLIDFSQTPLHYVSQDMYPITSHFSFFSCSIDIVFWQKHLHGEGFIFALCSGQSALWQRSQRIGNWKHPVTSVFNQESRPSEFMLVVSSISPLVRFRIPGREWFHHSEWVFPSQSNPPTIMCRFPRRFWILKSWKLIETTIHIAPISYNFFFIFSLPWYIHPFHSNTVRM